jgi:hypothetical protein
VETTTVKFDPVSVRSQPGWDRWLRAVGEEFLGEEFGETAAAPAVSPDPEAGPPVLGWVGLYPFEFGETAGAADPEAECIMYVAPDGKRIRMTVAEYRERGL